MLQCQEEHFLRSSDNTRELDSKRLVKEAFSSDVVVVAEKEKSRIMSMRWMDGFIKEREI